MSGNLRYGSFQERAQLLEVLWYRQVGESDRPCRDGADAGRRDAIAEEVGLCYAESSLGRGKLEVVLAQTLEQLADGADMFCEANAGSNRRQGTGPVGP